MNHEETEERGSAAAGGCVLLVLSSAGFAVVFALSTEAGILAVWVVGVATVWWSARHQVSDSSATPPPGDDAPIGDEEAGQTLADGTTLVRREGMLIYRTPDPDNPVRTLVRVEHIANQTHA